MTDDLAAWLLEQIAEDERVAREVSAVDMAGAMVPGANGGVGPRWDAKDGMVFAEGIAWDGTTEGFRGTMLWDARNRHGTSSFAAVHMARWDPARVLAECDAKRQVVRWVLTWPWRPPPPSSVDGLLEALALPYADRPGYREEWRP